MTPQGCIFTKHHLATIGVSDGARRLLGTFKGNNLALFGMHSIVNLKYAKAYGEQCSY